MRDKVFTIRLTEQERLKLGRSAEKMGMKPGQYLRGFINAEIVAKPTKQQIEDSVSRAFKSLV